MQIRFEHSADEEAIRAVRSAAFPTSMEAELVDMLRQAGSLAVSLVAVLDDRIVGHIAFSPLDIPPGAGLAPLAVHPDKQRQGIGSELVRAGLDACRELGFGFVVVLGEPSYYGRFGFQPASKWNLKDEYGGGDAFQAMELMPGSIPADGGLVCYAPEFGMFGDT